MSQCGKCWGTGAKIDHARLGKAARKRRIANGVTLADQARKLGISDGHLCYLEQGKRSWTEALYDEALK